MKQARFLYDSPGAQQYFQQTDMARRIPFFVIKLAIAALLLHCVLLVSFSGSARAQEGGPEEILPSMSLTPEQLKSQAPTQQFQSGVPVFNYTNPYLNDTLALQYQNILLQKMIMRQGTIARTEKSFMDVGVPFQQPAPPRGICEQIPVNIPCYKAYPDLYPGALPVVSEIEEGALNEPDIDLSDIPPVNTVVSAPAPPPPSTDLGAYNWAEIMCAGGKCSAVVIIDDVRRTVRAGDVIDDDVQIVSISSNGVEVEKDGKTQKLGSALAPSRGGVGSPKYAASQGRYIAKPKLSGSTSEQAEQLESFFESNPEEQDADNEEETAEAVPPPEPVANAPVDDPGPPLGNTGLY